MGVVPRPADYRAIWNDKPVLRAIYTNYYERIRAASIVGPTLEIGGGSGNLKEFAPGVVTTDITRAPWLDAVCDAQTLPFAEACFANIVLVDVLHHIARPALFFAEAERILVSGGRLIMIEPGITPLSGIFYRLFHDEAVDMSVDPLDTTPPPRKEPFDGNQAIPTLLFRRERARLADTVPGLQLVKQDRLSLFAYPLSGGFRPWSLLPAKFVRPLLAAEHMVMPALGPLCAFRILVVMEKR